MLALYFHYTCLVIIITEYPKHLMFYIKYVHELSSLDELISTIELYVRMNGVMYTNIHCRSTHFKLFWQQMVDTHLLSLIILMMGLIGTKETPALYLLKLVLILEGKS